MHEQNKPHLDLPIESFQSSKIPHMYIQKLRSQNINHKWLSFYDQYVMDQEKKIVGEKRPNWKEWSRRANLSS
jgi:hypothetical protein